MEDDFLENDLVFQDYHYDDYNYDAEKTSESLSKSKGALDYDYSFSKATSSLQS